MTHHTDAVSPLDDAGDYVGRLAPSPTGALHLGNARTFLIAWSRCRSFGGTLVMRMEDLDHPKVKPETIDEAYEDLRWLGLDWDEGPHVQSRFSDRHREAFERLRRLERIYPCVCTRADVEAAQSAPHAGEELRYPNTCRDRFRDATHAEEEGGRIPAWRFRAPLGESHFVDRFCGLQTADLHVFSGDFVVARSAGKPAYQLAVAVDDAAMGITEVVRAQDLLPSTHRQLALYDALGLHPPAFLHVPLVVGSDGRRLAKRHGDTRIRALREAGTPPERVVGWLASTCGWVEPGTACMPRKLLPKFSVNAIPPTQVVVDREVLRDLGVG